MVSILLPTMVPLHGILCHSHSDINRNLIASSEHWKFICFLSINELNTHVVFFYFHLPTINTTLVITNLTYLSYYWHYCNYSVLNLCFAYSSLNTLVCPAELSRSLLLYIFYHMFILCFLLFFIMLVLFVFVLWMSPVQYNVHHNYKACRAFLG